jgi:hypothetical protein
LFTLHDDPHLGIRVCPRPLPGELADLVPRAHRAPWPVWLDRGPRMLRDVLDVCRLQTARNLSVLAWLAAGTAPADRDWLWSDRRLSGARQRRMYGEAAKVPDPVLGLVIANWTWMLSTPHGSRVTAPYLAGTAYAEDGYQAAQAAITLARVYQRNPDARPALSAAWAASRTADDWCMAAQRCAAYKSDAPVFTYPRGPLPTMGGLRPWISYLFRLL